MKQVKQVKTVKIIKAACGLKYYLTDNYLMDSAPTFYFASRECIADAFNGATDIAYRTVYGERSGYSPNYDESAPVTIEKNRIIIGCQVFAGKNFKALKRWAKGF